MKILCVGQNYARHVAELGSSPSDAPVWFWKPESAIVRDGEPVRIPDGVGSVHHEVELALRIGGRGPDGVAVPDAMTVAVDVTAREMQNAAKKAGKPWDQAKGYDTFLPLGEWVPLADDLQDLRLCLEVDGEVRQDGTTADMTWSVRRLLELAAEWTTLMPGDVLLTGTPDGVGPIEPGQEMVARIVGHVRLRTPVVARSA